MVEEGFEGLLHLPEFGARAGGDAVVPLHSGADGGAAEVGAADVGGGAVLGSGEEVAFGVEADFAWGGFEEAEVDFAGEVEESLQGVGVGGVHVVACHQAERAVSLFEEVQEVGFEDVHAALEDEGYGYVGLGGGVQVTEEVGHERVVQAFDELARGLGGVGLGWGFSGLERFIRPGQVVGFGGNDVPHPSPGIRHVSFESGDDVDVQMKHRLPRRLAYVDADVVAVRRAVFSFYGVFGDVNCVDEGLLLFGRGFEPGGDESGWD